MQKELFDTTMSQDSDFTEYQDFTRKTAIYPPDEAMTYLLLGLSGEAGEMCNKYKKVIRDDESKLSSAKAAELADELGDVLWYLARIADELHVDFATIALKNAEKLQSRLERGKLSGSGDTR